MAMAKAGTEIVETNHSTDGRDKELSTTDKSLYKYNQISVCILGYFGGTQTGGWTQGIPVESQLGFWDPEI